MRSWRTLPAKLHRSARLGLILHAIDFSVDPGGVAKVLATEALSVTREHNRFKPAVQFVYQGHRGRDVETDDLVLRHVVKILHQSAEGVPVGADDDLFPRPERW